MVDAPVKRGRGRPKKVVSETKKVAEVSLVPSIEVILLEVGKLEKLIKSYFDSLEGKLHEVDHVDRKRLQDIGAHLEQIHDDFEMHLIDLEEEGESVADSDSETEADDTSDLED